MSSYNSITKIKYTGTPTDVVTLQEYILFQDDKAKKKYIIFHFINNVTQQLLGMQFEVCQYNVDGNLIEKSVVVYNKFLAGAEEAFVPKAKLRVSFYCNTISIRIIQAAYDRFVWKEGEFEDNCYKFDHFFQDEQLLAANAENAKKSKRQLKAEAKAEGKDKKEKQVKPTKPTKRKKSKHPFIMKDATKKNQSRFPKFFNVVAMLAVIAFVVTSLILFKTDGTTFTEGDYDLRIVHVDPVLNETEVAIYGYNGTRTELIIPAKIGNYIVVKVDSGAFENSKIKTVEFKGDDVIIERDAFKNCANLTSVLSEKYVIVQELAFTECPALVNVNLPNGTLTAGAFAGCTGIKELVYLNVDKISREDVITVPVKQNNQLPQE